MNNWNISPLLFIVILIIAAIVLAFEIWMFVDTIQNPRISTNRKVLWCIGMFLLHPFVALAYYFTDHKLVD